MGIAAPSPLCQLRWPTVRLPSRWRRRRRKPAASAWPGHPRGVWSWLVIHIITRAKPTFGQIQQDKPCFSGLCAKQEFQRMKGDTSDTSLAQVLTCKRQRLAPAALETTHPAAKNQAARTCRPAKNWTIELQNDRRAKGQLVLRRFHP